MKSAAQAGARRILIVAALIGLLVGGIAWLTQSDDVMTVPASPRLTARLVDLPLTFERNDGQTDARVRYLARRPST